MHHLIPFNHLETFGQRNMLSHSLSHLSCALLAAKGRLLPSVLRRCLFGIEALILWWLVCAGTIRPGCSKILGMRALADCANEHIRLQDKVHCTGLRAESGNRCFYYFGCILLYCTRIQSCLTSAVHSLCACHMIRRKHRNLNHSEPCILPGFPI